MNIAKLNTKIIIQRSELIIDDIGNQELIWNDFYNCFSSISGFNGDEKEGESSVYNTERLNFTIRYCNASSKINSENYRVLYDEKIYNISSVDPMANYNKTLKLKCELER